MIPARSFFLAVIIGCSLIGWAQMPVCTSLPLPPYFVPNIDNEEGRSGNSYAVPFDTILFNQKLGTQGFDIVICIDGAINANQISKADNYIDSLVARLQTVTHYNDRFKYFNIYRVAKFSNQEGAAWGYAGDTTVDNRYGSRYNSFSLARLLTPQKLDTFFADVMQYVPDYDIAINLVYDKKYGGSGWSLYDGRKVASFSIEEETGWHLGDEVIIHEIQHIMPYANHGYLGDEYEDSVACAIYDSIPRSPNVTSDTVNERKWQHCEGIAGVGYYPNAGICLNNYRPFANCAMHAVFQMPPFCPVCRENSTAYFDSVINPIYYTSSGPAQFIGSYTYKVSVDTPLNNTFRFQWFLDGSFVAQGKDSLTVNFDLLSNTTNHQLSFVCVDADPFIIDTTLRKPWVVNWLLETLNTSTVDLIAEFFAVELSPNPVKDNLQVAIKGEGTVTVIEILSPEGRLVIPSFRTTENKFNISTQSLATGVYYLVAKRGPEKRVTRLLKY